MRERSLGWVLPALTPSWPASLQPANNMLAHSQMRLPCESVITDGSDLENLVADDAEGHAASSLVSGLRFASTVLKFPIEVAGPDAQLVPK